MLEKALLGVTVVIGVALIPIAVVIWDHRNETLAKNPPTTESPPTTT